MATVRNSLVGLALRVRRGVEARRQPGAPEGLPPGTGAAYRPPRWLTRRNDVSVRSWSGWPVYSVRARGGGDSAAGTRPVVVYLHGGAYVAEVDPFHWRLSTQLAQEARAEIVVPLYPLAPAATAATTVPEAADLIAGLLELHGAGQVTLMGDSAGGGLALAAAQLLRDRGLQPRRIVLISPWLDVSCSDPRQREIASRDVMLDRSRLVEAGRAYAGSLPASDPRVSPLHGEMSGLAPLTILTSSRDLLTTDSHALAQAARAAGVEVDLEDQEGLFHVYPLLPTPEGAAARHRLVELVKSA